MRSASPLIASPMLTLFVVAEIISIPAYATDKTNFSVMTQAQKDLPDQTPFEGSREAIPTGTRRPLDRNGPDFAPNVAPSMFYANSIFSHFQTAASQDPKVAPGNKADRLPLDEYDRFSSPIRSAGSQTLCGASPLAPDEIGKLVGDSAKRYGVDPSFAKAIAWTESRFNQQRNSPKGARGPMQLIPETAARFDVADICDPIANIDGGMRYLRSLLDRFGNPLLAAAAYNAGEDRVYQHHGIPPYAETVRYVANVVNYQLGLAEPARPPAGRIVRRQQPIEAAAPDVMGATRVTAFVNGVMQF